MKSIYGQPHQITHEVIVSDNGSVDGSVEFVRANFPDVRLLENNANLGFAKANNVGIRASSGHYLLILNPDTIVMRERWISGSPSLTVIRRPGHLAVAYSMQMALFMLPPRHFRRSRVIGSARGG